MQTELPIAAIRLSLSGALLTRLEEWRRKQKMIPPRKRAVEQLLEQALNERSA
jgi:hypothetical protein